ncbi:MAG TPA: type II toxin-antitoxin system RelE/ParE family toxin [bacterium]|nr:type II toxin-antitoxin system RelE/ParE family toxin [bacterium]
MSYRLEMRPRARRTLGGLPKDDARRVDSAILSLADEPRPDGSRKLRGAGDLYRIRVGSYRVVYEIDDSIRIVVISRIGHRRDVYR